MKDIANSASRNGSSTAPVDEVLPVTQMILYGLQHVLVMYAGAVELPFREAELAISFMKLLSPVRLHSV